MTCRILYNLSHANVLQRKNPDFFWAVGFYLDTIYTWDEIRPPRRVRTPTQYNFPAISRVLISKKKMEPKTTVYKCLFQLDDSKYLVGKLMVHQTSIKNWLFRVPWTWEKRTSPSSRIKIGTLHLYENFFQDLNGSGNMQYYQTINVWICMVYLLTCLSPKTTQM